MNNTLHYTVDLIPSLVIISAKKPIFGITDPMETESHPEIHGIEDLISEMDLNRRLLTIHIQRTFTGI